MKKIVFHIALLLFLPFLAEAQTLLYPQITTDEVTDLVFLNQTDGILINKAGTIMKTTDGGFNWKIVKFYQGMGLNEIKFLDANTGFIRMYNEIIFTTDRGDTWEKQSISLADAYTFLPVTESVILKATKSGKILRLDNFYNIWEEVYAAPTFIIPPEGCFGTRIEPYGYINKFIKFASGRILSFGTSDFAKARNVIKDSITYILKSDDTGKTWDTLWVGLKQALATSTFSDEKNGWMGGSKELYKTTDGGETWENIHLDLLGSNIYKIFAVDSQNIWGVTYWNVFSGIQFIKSTDSGMTWSTNYIGDYEYGRLLVINSTTGFLFGSKLQRTGDGGGNWIDIDKSAVGNIASISFSSQQSGFAVSGYSGNNSLYKTSDGGKTWNKSFVQEEEARQVKMINNSIGWLVAKNKVYKTVNGGATWETPVSLNSNYSYAGITCLGDNHAILYNVKPNSSETYYNLITNDGGQSWEKFLINNFSYTDLPYNFQYLDKNHLYAMNKKGLWLTEDTTKTWKMLHDFENRYAECFSFYDKNIGVLFADFQTGSITFDGGATWNQFDKVVGGRANKCKMFGANFKDQYSLFTVGDGGLMQYYLFYKNSQFMYKYNLNSFTKQSLTDIDVVVENKVNFVMMGGYGFTLLKYDAGASFVGINSDQEIATEYNLYQNYPNPFNPVTKIKYLVNVQSKVEIKVYNILGKEIKTLVNEVKSQGSYEVTFDASQFSSGVYFYRIQTPSFSETKKMVYLK